MSWLFVVRLVAKRLGPALLGAALGLLVDAGLFDAQLAARLGEILSGSSWSSPAPTP